jgi:hypothetical protein
MPFQADKQSIHYYKLFAIAVGLFENALSDSIPSRILKWTLYNYSTFFTANQIIYLNK